MNCSFEFKMLVLHNRTHQNLNTLRSLRIIKSSKINVTALFAKEHRDLLLWIKIKSGITFGKSETKCALLDTNRV